MNDDERGNELPVSEADTTPPNPADAAVPSPGQGWQMPAPKFQQSSGYLPQGYLEKAGFDVPLQAAASGAAAAPAAEAPPTPALDVEPQPDLTEQLDDQPAETAPKPVAKQRSTGSRVAMIVLGLLAMAAFIAAFLALVYYLFLAPQNGGSPF
jgi:hypothetical protein